jgi:hypothetical protein
VTGKVCIDSHWDEATIRDRFPEVELINDTALRAETIDALRRSTPDYFWEMPASTSGKYHNPFTRMGHGLHIHVKMTLTVYERIVDSWVQLGRISEYEADCGRAALLLHDVLKAGHTYEDGDHSVENHDVLAATWLRHNTELPTEVIDAVAAHNGPWMVGPEPDSELSLLVHTCDMVASDANVTAGVFKPDERLVEKYPSLPQATL